MKRILLSVALVATLAMTATAQALVSGRVYASDGMTGIRGARVTLVRQFGGQYSTLTNGFGYYALSVPYETYYGVLVSARGYAFNADLLRVWEDDVSEYDLTAQ